MRYGLTAVLAVIGVVIAPRAFENGRLYSVMLVAMIVSTRVIVVAPRRFEMRNATLGWRRLWYLLLGQIALLGIAFALALEPRGSVPGAWAALAVAAGIEIFALRREPAEHVRAGTLVPWLRYIPSNESEELGAERPTLATNAFKNALADAYAEIPTGRSRVPCDSALGRRSRAACSRCAVRVRVGRRRRGDCGGAALPLHGRTWGKSRNLSARRSVRAPAAHRCAAVLRTRGTIARFGHVMRGAELEIQRSAQRRIRSQRYVRERERSPRFCGYVPRVVLNSV